MNYVSLIASSLNKTNLPSHWENDFIETKLGRVSEWRSNPGNSLRPAYISVLWEGDHFVYKFKNIEDSIRLLKYFIDTDQSSFKEESDYTRMTKHLHDSLVNYVKEHPYPESEFDDE